MLYDVTVTIAGYQTWRVEADNEEEATNTYTDGELWDEVIDNTEIEQVDVVE
jgi:hypothetical protein